METYITFTTNVRDQKPQRVDLIGTLKKYHHEDEEHHLVIQRIQAEQDKDVQRKMKSDLLPCLIPAALFKTAGTTGTSAEQLMRVEPIVFIDIDGLNFEDVANIKQKLIESIGKYCYFIGISPSGKGLHALVNIANPDKHREHWLSIKQFLKKLGLTVDEATHDVTRKMYIGCDRQAFINEEEVEDWKNVIEMQKRQSIDNNHLVNPDNIDRVESCMEQMEEKKINAADPYDVWIKIGTAFAQGLRESGREFFHRFSGTSPKYKQDDCDKKYDELLKSTGKDTRKDKITLGTFFHYCNNILGIQPQKLTENYETPTLSDDVIPKLPEIIRNVADRYSEKRERDVAVISMFVLISSMLINVLAIHRKQKRATNLFAIIVAGYSSGKSAMAVIRRIGDVLHKYLTGQATEAKEQYEGEMEEYKSRKKEGEMVTKPKDPGSPMMFVAADISSASFGKLLIQAGGRMMMFDTEPDGLSSAMKQDWGDSLSGMLRRTISNEPVNISRLNKDNPGGEVSFTAVSGLLSGTPRSVAMLIPDLENGLHSRILFNCFEILVEIANDTFSHEGWDALEKEDEMLGQIILKVYQRLEKLDNKRLIFLWQDHQQEVLLDSFRTWLAEQKALVGNYKARTLFRLAEMTTKLAATITAWRFVEGSLLLTDLEFLKQWNGEQDLVINCSQDDLEILVKIIGVVRQHGLYMIENLPKNEEEKPPVIEKSAQLNFYNKLPCRFTRKEAIKIGSKSDIKERTCDKYLKALVEKKLLSRDDTGYTKITA